MYKKRLLYSSLLLLFFLPSISSQTQKTKFPSQPYQKEIKQNFQLGLSRSLNDSGAYYLRHVFNLAQKHQDQKNMLIALTHLCNTNEKDSIDAYIQLAQQLPPSTSKISLITNLKIRAENIFLATHDSIDRKKRTIELIREIEKQRNNPEKNIFDLFSSTYALTMHLQYCSTACSCCQIIKDLKKILTKIPKKYTSIYQNTYQIIAISQLRMYNYKAAISPLKQLIDLLKKAQEQHKKMGKNYTQAEIMLYINYIRLMKCYQYLRPEEIATCKHFFLSKSGKLGKKKSTPYIGKTSADQLFFYAQEKKFKDVLSLTEQMIKKKDTGLCSLDELAKMQMNAIFKLKKERVYAHTIKRDIQLIDSIHQLHIKGQRKRFTLLMEELTASGNRNRTLAKEKEAQYERTESLIYTEAILAGLLAISIAILAFYLQKSKHLLRSEKEAKKKLTLAKEEAEKARNEALVAKETQTKFMHNMNHEIRTPVNAIVGFSGLLSEELELEPEEREEYVYQVQKNGELLIQLVNDVLDTARLDAGDYPLEMEHHLLNKICRNALSSIQNRVKKEVSLTFQTQIADDMLLYTDDKRIMQILINFLSNACKHTEKGKITLSCKLNKYKNKVVFSVEDTGTGIPKDKQELLFQRFSKLNTYAQGTGLGLNISYSLSKLLGGKVYLDKSYTAGARFQFEHPLQ